MSLLQHFISATEAMVAGSEGDLLEENSVSAEACNEDMDTNSDPTPSPTQTKDEEAGPRNESTPVASSTPPANDDGRVSVIPIMTNAIPARPPSSASVHSASSSGPRSTTATSRRGGRTRSRSPPMMISNRPPSTGPQLESVTPNEDRRSHPTLGNPSAAAAAAAAAAKSITRNPPPPPPSSWYDSQDGRSREYRRSRGEAPRYHPRYFEGNPPTRTHWSPDDDASNRPPSQNRYIPTRRPVPEEHYGYREGYVPYRSRDIRGEPYAQPGYDKEYERRYADPRYDERRQHATTSMPPQYDYRARNASRPPHRDDPYYAQGKEDDSGRTPVALTTRVIGGPTPIHLPRASDAPSPRRSRSESQSESIFRGRPRSDAPNPPTLGEEVNAQVLMSLRTPSSSFEEKTTKRLKREGTFSPEAPPQIQHSHHQSDSLFDVSF